jgi:hypothetical protein
VGRDMLFDILVKNFGKQLSKKVLEIKIFKKINNYART